MFVPSKVADPRLSCVADALMLPPKMNPRAYEAMRSSVQYARPSRWLEILREMEREEEPKPERQPRDASHALPRRRKWEAI
jgi:hypothetical protein